MNLVSGIVNGINAPDVSYNQVKVGSEAASNNASSSSVDSAVRAAETTIEKDNILSLDESFVSYDSASANQAIKALSNALLPVNDFTIAMTEGMIDFGKNIGKDSLLAMFRDVSKFPDVNPKDIIVMKELGVELNESNVTRFEAFLNYKDTIAEGLNDIVRDIPSAFEQIIDSGSTQKAADFLKDVIGVLSSEDSAKDATVVNQGLGANDMATTDVAEGKVIIKDNSELTNNLMNLQQADVMEDVKQKTTMSTLDMVGNDNIILADENVAGLKGESNILSGNLPVSEDKLTYQDTVGVANQSMKPEMGANMILTEDKVILPDEKDTWQSMTTFEKARFVEVLKEAGIPENEAKQLYDSEATSADFLKNISKALDNKDNARLFRDIVRDERFASMLKDTTVKHWTLKPEQVQSKVEVDSLYSRLERETRAITQALEKAISDSADKNSSLARDLNNMNQNMDFLHQMNNVYQYVQLPLKMAGAETTGDLFVFTDKKSLANKDGNVSALLHLDMANLGPVDVYASITSAGSVFTKFYLKDDEMLDFINDNIHLLNERLESRGYSAKSEMVIKGADKGNDIVDNLVKDAPLRVAREKLVGKYSFDTRA